MDIFWNNIPCQLPGHFVRQILICAYMYVGIKMSNKTNFNFFYALYSLVLSVYFHIL